ncbi:hypothetical protein BT96DRAFT_631580 [Gymnopus androsaceus JB14]|uniref:Uncharacterized protein n=1 Tax=Gymnopus androsaceus JB14 TaxID=1447944 RepID=A0A6A4HU87_9AGAR|nr:hypothetical protein BT96DRAFT_631580 [Gymnopus androsaceus JB14]
MSASRPRYRPTPRCSRCLPQDSSGSNDSEEDFQRLSRFMDIPLELWLINCRPNLVGQMKGQMLLLNLPRGRTAISDTTLNNVGGSQKIITDHRSDNRVGVETTNSGLVTLSPMFISIFTSISALENPRLGCFLLAY